MSSRAALERANERRALAAVASLKGAARDWLSARSALCVADFVLRRLPLLFALLLLLVQAATAHTRTQPQQPNERSEQLIQPSA